MNNNEKKHIHGFALVMLMTGAVDGISNIPSIAIFGQPLVFFFILASLLFLIPVGFISAELCAQFKDDSGVYAWVKKALGPHFAILAIWLQWINTMVWFPTCLTTIVGTIAYLFMPSQLHNPYFLVFTSLAIFWLMTWINLKGLKQSARVASLATSFGMLLPIVIIIALSGCWLVLGKKLAVNLNASAIFPDLHQASTWSSLTAVVTSFLGMELATVHVRKVQGAHQKFPKALLITVVIIIFTMGLGSLGVVLIIPHDEIALVAGTIQAFHTLLVGLHATALANVLGVMVLFGSLGAMINWLISPANGLAQAAEDGYLPQLFSRENEHGVPKNLLLLQAIVVSIIIGVFFLLPSVNGSYWLLLSLSTELYVTMYVLMFLAAFVLLIKTQKIRVIPGGKIGALFCCCLGILSCLIVLAVGFIPPGAIDIGEHHHYQGFFIGAFLLMLSPAFLLQITYKFRKLEYGLLLNEEKNGI